MNHYNSTPEEKEEKLREATQVCIDGLLDEDTHLSEPLFRFETIYTSIQIALTLITYSLSTFTITSFDPT
jgi:predicted RNase H-like HicB family nuclease